MSTQDATLREIIELAFEDEQLRHLLKTDGIRTIALLKQDPQIWLNLPKPIQSRVQRAFIALAEENAGVKDLVYYLQTSPLRKWKQTELRLKSCLL